MSELSWRNREKYEDDEVLVSRNHEFVNSPEDAVFFTTFPNRVVVSTQKAREIAAALIEAADEFDAAVEASKPNGEDFVRNLPIGARFRSATQDPDQYWIKTGADQVFLGAFKEGINPIQTNLHARHFKGRTDLELIED